MFFRGENNMEADKITMAINELPLVQKLLIAQNIWDSIAEESGKLSMPEWQKIELEKRYREYKTGRIGLHDWREVHDGLRAEHK
jgi:putative addiction module component (TIGR02574 family)